MSALDGRTTILAGVTFFSMACSPPAVPPPPPINPGGPPVVFDPIGQNGGNGLEPAIYLDNRAELDRMMGEPLAQPPTAAGLPLAGRIQTFLSSAPSSAVRTNRQTLIEYAADCALPFATYDQLEEPGAGTKLFHGQLEPDAGLLQTTGGWPSVALTTDQRTAVSTCLITRLNPSGTHVSIWLAGADVNRTSRPGAGGFDFVEAHWLALPSPITITGLTAELAERRSLLVWPSRQWKDKCHGDVNRLTQDARTRVCGTEANAGRCDVMVAPDTWCSEQAPGNGIWFCTVPPSPAAPTPSAPPTCPASPTSPPSPLQCLHAIETRLQRNDWVILHAGCAKP